MFKKVTYSIKDFFRRVHNVYRWLPTIWKDRDWDDSYITEILIRKLEFTRDFYLSDKAYNAEADEVAEQIQEAIDRLHQTKDSWEFYEDPAIEQLQEKWGRTTFSFEPFTHDDDGNVLTYEMKSKVEKANTLDDEEQYSKEFRESLQEVRQRYMQDKKDAYKFIAENIDKWWD